MTPPELCSLPTFLGVYSAFEYATMAESMTRPSDDHREGAIAFREKRAPYFKGC